MPTSQSAFYLHAIAYRQLKAGADYINSQHIITYFHTILSYHHTSTPNTPGDVFNVRHY